MKPFGEQNNLKNVNLLSEIKMLMRSCFFKPFSLHVVTLKVLILKYPKL